MKRALGIGALTMGTFLVAADAAHAQRWGGGRGGAPGLSFSYGNPGGYGYNYGNPGGYGYNYGNPGGYGYNYGNPYGGFYGRSSYYYAPSTWGYRPNYGTWYNSYPGYYNPPAGQYPSGGSINTQNMSDYQRDQLGTNATDPNRAWSFYQGNQGNSQTELRIRVPDPDARVTIDDQPTTQRGTDRVFSVPPLEPGRNYTYTVRASWMDGNQEVSREKKLDFKAGDPLNVDFADVPADADASRQPNKQPTVEERSANAERAASEQLRDQAVSGKIVRIDGNRISVQPTDGGAERTFQVADDAVITRNGSKVTLKQLTTDTSVAISTQAGSPTIATQIEIREVAEGGAIIP